MFVLRVRADRDNHILWVDQLERLEVRLGVVLRVLDERARAVVRRVQVLRLEHLDAGLVLAPLVVADDALPARLVRIAGQHHGVAGVGELQDDAVLVHDLLHLRLVELLLGVDVAGRREAADRHLAVLADRLPDRAAALRPLRLLVRVLLLHALELGVVAGDLLQLLRVLRQPELDDLVAVVEVADAGDVVVVRVRDRQHVEPLPSVVAVGEDVVEQLEQVDALAGATVDVDHAVAIAGDPDQRRVAMPDVDEGNFEFSHPVPFWQPLRPPGQRVAEVMVQLASAVTVESRAVRNRFGGESRAGAGLARYRSPASYATSSFVLLRSPSNPDVSQGRRAGLPRWVRVRRILPDKRPPTPRRQVGRGTRSGHLNSSIESLAWRSLLIHWVHWGSLHIPGGPLRRGEKRCTK